MRAADLRVIRDGADAFTSVAVFGASARRSANVGRGLGALSQAFFRKVRPRGEVSVSLSRGGLHA